MQYFSLLYFFKQFFFSPPLFFIQFLSFSNNFQKMYVKREGERKKSYIPHSFFLYNFSFFLDYFLSPTLSLNNFFYPLLLFCTIYYKKIVEIEEKQWEKENLFFFKCIFLILYYIYLGLRLKHTLTSQENTLSIN